MEQKPGKAFYQRQIAALEAHDLDALIAQYHPDAAMIGFDWLCCKKSGRSLVGVKPPILLRLESDSKQCSDERGLA